MPVLPHSEPTLYSFAHRYSSRYLTDFGFSKSNMMAIYQSLLAEPASYMPYTIGYLEIDDLLNDAKKQLGRKFVLKDFHKFFLSLGPVPLQFLLIPSFIMNTDISFCIQTKRDQCVFF